MTLDQIYHALLQEVNKYLLWRWFIKW